MGRQNLGLSFHQEIGLKFEMLVKDLFTHSFGMDICHISNWCASFDLEFEGKMVEVKSAYPTTRLVKGRPHTRWQFDLASKVVEDTEFYVVLVAIDSDDIEYMYFIPSSEITGPTIQLTSHPDKYSGKYAKYRNNFDGMIEFLNGV